MRNINNQVVNDFGDEWKYYDQSGANLKLHEAFSQYFCIFPDKYLNSNSVGFDAGCGSGRWAKFIAPKVKQLFCIEPSKNALIVAQKNLSEYKNCSFECASINQSSIKNESMDFGYCLGVLHHIPEPYVALRTLVLKLKKNAPLLIYIYYRFDNKPIWYKNIWKLSELLRSLICNLQFFLVAS